MKTKAEMHALKGKWVEVKRYETHFSGFVIDAILDDDYEEEEELNDWCLTFNKNTIRLLSKNAEGPDDGIYFCLEQCQSNCIKILKEPKISIGTTYFKGKNKKKMTSIIKKIETKRKYKTKGKI